MKIEIYDKLELLYKVQALVGDLHTSINVLDVISCIDLYSKNYLIVEVSLIADVIFLPIECPDLKNWGELRPQIKDIFKGYTYED